MDMSIKLNASYPAGTTQASVAAATQVSTANETTTGSTAEPQRMALEKAVTDMREFVQASQRNLDFSIDDSTGRVVVKVIATDSGEVIRQIPSETALKLAQDLSKAGSLLFDSKA
ncbi:flagellar biosynthesis protein FlaG [Pseudomonas nabeulensis]|uniref:Flagellar biosynthesis protein FlaG n=1 Tax=Pseudomonas nabeulensis TaxID=2293833 RepID=A0A4Z0ASD0_9PSED|nr:flagellar protein FlaG [Pseudomonas nabeulensis]TFY89712.1 flagellar biosynthesis protein FlaG [Pseudomonas nabeulensis]